MTFLFGSDGSDDGTASILRAAADDRIRVVISNQRRGKVGMMMSGPWEIQNLRSEKKFSWDIGPLPRNRKRATMLGLENYGISAVTEDPELSFKFLEFLLEERN